MKELCQDLWHQNTRGLELSYGIVCVMIVFLCLVISVTMTCDRWTDTQQLHIVQ